ncbi:MAG: hypothetical protein KDG50_15035 [Chromatiales bacterium]|nr:hypothetical protein [Chromatiales bacterium]
MWQGARIDPVRDEVVGAARLTTAVRLEVIDLSVTIDVDSRETVVYVADPADSWHRVAVMIGASAAG